MAYQQEVSDPLGLEFLVFCSQCSQHKSSANTQDTLGNFTSSSKNVPVDTAVCTEGPAFKHPTSDRLGFSSLPSKQMHVKSGHDRFLPRPLQFTKSSNHRRYIIRATVCVVHRHINTYSCLEFEYTRRPSYSHFA